MKLSLTDRNTHNRNQFLTTTFYLSIPTFHLFGEQHLGFRAKQMKDI